MKASGSHASTRHLGSRWHHHGFYWSGDGLVRTRKEK